MSNYDMRTVFFNGTHGLRVFFKLKAAILES